MAEVSYEGIPGFEGVYLEDSFVLGIQEPEGCFLIDLEAVLTPQHPLYGPPRENEHYCFRKGRIVFPGVRQVIWHERRMVPNSDANGEVDYGNVDSFIADDGRYRLEGDWGRVEIHSETPRFEMTEH